MDSILLSLGYSSTPKTLNHVIICGGSWFKKQKKLAAFPAKALKSGFCSNGNGEGESKSAAGVIFLLLCASEFML